MSAFLPGLFPTLRGISPQAYREQNRNAFLSRLPIDKRRQIIRTRWNCTLPARLSELAYQLQQSPDVTSRYLKVAALGDQMKSIAEEKLTTSSRVSGCTSITHILVTLNADETVSLSGYSDARISRGLVALLVLGLDGSLAEDILQISGLEVLAASKLPGTVSSSRAMGVSSIIRAIQDGIKSQMVDTTKSSETHSMTGRWSSRQGADVAVLLSGGVDSSVALRLVLESGARAHPFYLKVWLDDEMAHLGECPWEEDIRYATAVCEQAGVKLRDVAFQQAYYDQVVAYTVSEARRGRTPNPDVMCNTRIKFGAFYERFGRDYDSVATGHYARRGTCEQSGKAELWVSPDQTKDQTYFLAHLSQKQVAKALFPVGGLSKARVREMANEYGLANRGRKDSQGICFLGKLKFDDFLRHHLGERKGSLVEFESGRELGFHRGFWFFTVGQRRGIGLSGGPWYVVWKDMERNVVFVSREYDGSRMRRNWFQFESAVWIAGDWPHGLQHVGATLEMCVKTRHAPGFHVGAVTRSSADGGSVQLENGDQGLAPGQFAVFYDTAGRCFGSGVIHNDISLHHL